MPQTVSESIPQTASIQTCQKKKSPRADKSVRGPVWELPHARILSDHDGVVKVIE